MSGKFNEFEKIKTTDLYEIKVAVADDYYDEDDVGTHVSITCTNARNTLATVAGDKFDRYEQEFFKDLVFRITEFMDTVKFMECEGVDNAILNE